VIQTLRVCWSQIIAFYVNVMHFRPEFTQSTETKVRMLQFIVIFAFKSPPGDVILVHCKKKNHD